jgi:hypothetical protein
VEYTLKTDIFEGGIIKQSLVHDQSAVLCQWVCDTKEESIRNALIKLGWAPPCIEGKSQSSLKKVNIE